MRPLIPFLAVSALAACGGGGYGSNYGTSAGSGASCTSIGNNSGFSFSCNGCSSSDTGTQAADGDLNTFASLDPFDASTTSLSTTIRATAQSGIVYAAGSRAGMFLTIANNGGTSGTTLKTYLAGALQESSPPSYAYSVVTSGGTGAVDWMYFNTTKQFDAVEAVITNSWSSGSSAVTYKIYEICGDGHT